MNKLKVSDRARVIYGEHKGFVGTVAAVAECGHESCDQLWLQSDDASAKPVLVYRMALEPMVETSAEHKPAHGGYPDVPPAQARTQRFYVNDLVRIVNPARVARGQLGRVRAVFLDPFERKPSTGATGHSARYDIELLCYGHDVPAVVFGIDELYDWEIEREGGKS